MLRHPIRKVWRELGFGHHSNSLCAKSIIYRATYCGVTDDDARDPGSSFRENGAQGFSKNLAHFTLSPTGRAERAG
jgi:hypothetical protein